MEMKDPNKQKTWDDITRDEFGELELIGSEEYQESACIKIKYNPEEILSKNYLNFEKQGLTSKFLKNKNAIIDQYPNFYCQVLFKKYITN